MFCQKCGTQNNDSSSFCFSCGAKLSRPFSSQSEISKQYTKIPTSKPIQKPYKTEFVLGLIGSALGAAMFLIIFIVATEQISSFSSPSYYTGGNILISSFFALSSFILGFIGIALLNRGRGSGGVLLTVGGSLGLLAAIIGAYVGWITMFSFPLILVAGIIALVRKKHVEKLLSKI